MKADPEPTQFRNGQPPKAWPHGCLIQTGWRHFHPEHDLHLVTAAAGCVDAGVHAGPFGPGNLLHNRISDVAGGRKPSPIHRGIGRVAQGDRFGAAPGSVPADGAVLRRTTSLQPWTPPRPWLNVHGC